jgi:polyphosphate kinase
MSSVVATVPFGSALSRRTAGCAPTDDVRQEAAGVTRYVHIGTGNYNRVTAQVYTDLSLFTADPAVVDDVSEVFNALTGYSQRIDYRELLVAPANLRARLRGLIEREADHARAGRPARIIVKCNAITDPEIIATLYRASQAGVDVDMIIRGVCCLRPGVPDVSDRIRVRSVVGRFLEHSRLYYFENGSEPVAYIGSADLMERNLDRRVETLCRIREQGIARELRGVVLDAYLRDNERAYELVNDSYRRVVPAAGEARVSAQRLLLDWYTQKPAGTDDPQFAV